MKVYVWITIANLHPKEEAWNFLKMARKTACGLCCLSLGVKGILQPCWQLRHLQENIRPSVSTFKMMKLIRHSHRWPQSIHLGTHLVIFFQCWIWGVWRLNKNNVWGNEASRTSGGWSYCSEGETGGEEVKQCAGDGQSTVISQNDQLFFYKLVDFWCVAGSGTKIYKCPQWQSDVSSVNQSTQHAVLLRQQISSGCHKDFKLL